MNRPSWEKELICSLSKNIACINESDVKQLKLCADEQDDSGCFFLGYLYCIGVFVDRDITRGLQYLREAEKLGHPWARYSYDYYFKLQDDMN